MSGLLARIPRPGQRRREARGLLRELERLTDANREQPDAETERRLLRLRHRAFEYLELDPEADTVAPSAAKVPAAAGELPVLERRRAQSRSWSGPRSSRPDRCTSRA